LDLMTLYVVRFFQAIENGSCERCVLKSCRSRLQHRSMHLANRPDLATGHSSKNTKTPQQLYYFESHLRRKLNHLCGIPQEGIINIFICSFVVVLLWELIWMAGCWVWPIARYVLLLPRRSAI